MLKLKKKSLQGKNEIHILAHGHESQRHIAREIQALKLRLDIVLNSRAYAAGLVPEQDRAWACEMGFDLPADGPYGDGMDPSTFNALLTGGFYEELSSSGVLVLSEAPPDSLIGWKRRTYDPVSPEQAAAIAAQLRTRVIVDYDGTGVVYEPLELVILGEGKHRYELHAHHGLPLLLYLETYRYPAPERIRLRRVLGCPGMLHITYTRADGKKEERLLPFADLSRRLLATIGIAVEGVWVPTPLSSAVRRAAEKQGQEPGALRRMLQMCLKPELLSKAVLRGAYS